MWKTFKALIVISLTGGLSACGAGTDSTSAKVQIPTPSSKDNNSVKTSNDIIIDLSKTIFSDGIKIASGHPNTSYTHTTDGVLISGKPTRPRTSGGKTQGFYIELDKKLEAKLSGKAVTISLRAKSADAGGMRIAYSTNEVGNSGWIESELSSAFNTYSFEYAVPKMKTGRGDYLGILPLSNSIEVANVTISLN